MSDFRQLTPGFLAAPQIQVSDVAAAKELGVTLIVNNRPEGESDDQTPGDVIEAEARKLGLDYCAIPVTHAGFSESQVSGLVQKLRDNQGKVLAYCRSGTRSTLLWALARASEGDDPAVLAETALKAGYDLSPIGDALTMLSARAAK